MNNKRLVQIIKDPGIATEKEIKAISALSKDYSYSAFLKILESRIDNLHDKKSKSESLTRAAIYIADRIVLKDFISNDKLSQTKTEGITVKGGTAKEDVKKATKDVDKSANDIPSETVADSAEHVEKTSGDSNEKEKKKADPTIIEASKKAELSEDLTREEKDEEKLAETKDSEEIKTVAKTGDNKQEDEGTKEIIQEAKEEVTTIETVDMGEVAEEQKRKEITGVQTEKIETEAIEKVEKEVIEVNETISEVPEQPETTKEKTVEKKDFKDLESIETSGITSTEGSEPEGETALSAEIIKNISELKKHKASLFNLLELDGKEKHKSEKRKSKKSSGKGKDKKEVDQENDKPTLKSKEEIKEKPDTLNELPSAVETEEDYPGYEKEDPEVIKEFLDELEKTNPSPKRKLKKEEQKALIEKFIQSDPKLKNVRSLKEISEKQDLSLPSVKFRDDIISENLACIMVKQGKHEKAIDIYKKLIWKFPQKKAYFASQIEQLKKKRGK